jgi:hypothetical protein
MGAMLRRIGIPLLCLAFTATGVWALAEGAWAIGLTCVLFFGVGGIVLALPLVAPPDQPETRTIELDGEPAKLFVLGKGRQLVTAIAAIGMGVGSLMLVVAGNPVGLLGLLFLAVGVSQLQGIARARGLALTATRVVQLVNGRVEIPWEAVGWVAVQPMSRTRVLAVGAIDKDAVRRRGFARINRGFTSAEITIAAHQFAGSPEEIAGEVLRWRDNPRARDPL